ncbi:MAG: hypothetical protein FJ284_03095 [Planctomycetes bacterium]|nr:hypothetical protein [Planctomycetota bacterium]MBM4058623.1 hypothetical protein [Planctomycetota bacterium]
MAVAREAGVDAMLEQPISLADLANPLAQPVDRRSSILASDGPANRRLVMLPVGIKSAVITVAILMMG